MEYLPEFKVLVEYLPKFEVWCFVSVHETLKKLANKKLLERIKRSGRKSALAPILERQIAAAERSDPLPDSNLGRQSVTFVKGTPGSQGDKRE